MITRRKFLRSTATMLGGAVTSVLAQATSVDAVELVPKSPAGAKSIQTTPPLRHGAVAQANATKTAGLVAPILMYHHVGGKPGRYNISISEFAMQMRWLSENGYRTVSIDQIAAALRGQAVLPSKSVAITFDDGWRNQLNALPIMQDYDFSATFYLVANYVVKNSSYFFSWNDVATVLQNGHQLGSHSERHMPETRYAGAALMHDVVAARDAIKLNLGVTVSTHAYPYGSTNATVMKAVSNAGYTAAVGVWGRVQQSLGNIYNLNRIDARGGISTGDFANLMQGIAIQRSNTPASVPHLNDLAPVSPVPKIYSTPDAR